MPFLKSLCRNIGRFLRVDHFWSPWWKNRQILALFIKENVLYTYIKKKLRLQQAAGMFEKRDIISPKTEDLQRPHLIIGKKHRFNNLFWDNITEVVQKAKSMKEMYENLTAVSKI